MLRLTIPVRLLVWGLSACAILIVAAGIILIAVKFVYHHDYLLGFAPRFDLDGENSVPAWFSSIILFLSSCLLLLSGFLDRQRSSCRFPYWIGLAAIFLALSLDESASFHEAVSGILQSKFHTTGFLTWPWVIPGAVFAGAVALISRRFLIQLPSTTRESFLAAGAVYCAASMGGDMVGAGLDRLGLAYHAAYVIEESGEMLGVLLFIRALLHYLAAEAGSFELHLHGGPRRPE
jgi:hypothetical protein